MKKATIKKNAMGAWKSLAGHLLGAAIATGWYVLMPSVVKARGAAGMALGVLPPFLFGAATGNKTIQVAALTLPMAHLAYVYGGHLVNKTLGYPIWRFRGDLPTAENTLGSLRDGRRIVNVGGERILAETATDMPGMSDYIPNPARQLNDYVTAENIPATAFEAGPAFDSFGRM